MIETARYRAENSNLSSLLEDVHVWMEDIQRRNASLSCVPPQQRQGEIIDLLTSEVDTSAMDDASSMVVWSPPKKRAPKRSTLQAALQCSPTISAAPNRTKKKTKASSSPTTNRFASLQDFLPDADNDVLDDDEVDLDENEEIEIEFHPDTSLERAVAETAGKIQALTILRKKSGSGSNGAGRQP